jgi:hypothetical protein
LIVTAADFLGTGFAYLFGMVDSLPLLDESEIEAILRNHPQFQSFWQGLDHLFIVRKGPTHQDPVYEIQLAWQLGDRLESYAWIWVEALEGKILWWKPD